MTYKNYTVEVWAGQGRDEVRVLTDGPIPTFTDLLEVAKLIGFGNGDPDSNCYSTFYGSTDGRRYPYMVLGMHTFDEDGIRHYSEIEIVTDDMTWLDEDEEQAEELDAEFEDWMLNKYGPAWQVDTWAEVGADPQGYREELQREFNLFLEERA